MIVGFRQFRALCYKNFILRKRHWIKLIFEIAIPCGIFYLLYFLRGASSEDDTFVSSNLLSDAGNIQIFPFQQLLSYSEPANMVCRCYSYGGEDSCQIQTATGYPSSLLFCDAKKCKVDQEPAADFCKRKKLAVLPAVGDDEDLAKVAEDFADFLLGLDALSADFVTTQFKSQADLAVYLADELYSTSESIENIGAAIVWNKGYPHFDFTIRLNDTLYGEMYDSDQVPMPDTSSLFNAEKDITNVKACGTYNCLYVYAISTFYTLEQVALDFGANQVLDASGAVPPCPADGSTPLADCRLRSSGFVYPSLRNFPVASYNSSGFWGVVGGIFGPFLVIAFMINVASMIRELVLEKETKIREGMKMMSLGTGALLWSWILHFTIPLYIVGLIVCVLSQGLFLYSDPKIIGIYIFAFLHAIMAFSFWVSTIFSRAKTATVVGVLAYFIGYVMTFAIPSSSSNKIPKLLLSLHPAGAFVLGLDAFVEFEDSSIGVTSFTWATTSHADGYCFRDTVGMLLFDIFFWFGLAWYCDCVLPSEWGTQKHPLFLFSPWYWCPCLFSSGSTKALLKNQELGDIAEHSNENVEAATPELLAQLRAGEGIDITNLEKSFNTTAGVKRAVDGLYLRMFNNQITCLLGHNGAGKTTTIAMLTGLIPPSSGSALVMGKDVSHEMAVIRQDLGVCPQHDILFADLTVREHLSLFGTFKGVHGAELTKAVDEMIKAVGLEEKANVQSKSLSGGMKRKLSVGIAFMGGSKVVLLDEPTSGMDPYSRRFTWDVIKKMRVNRTIILTTHFMDEADILGDRIAIMAEGKLRCAGSSLFLKNKFGVGYTMSIEKGPRFDEKAVRSHIKSAIPDAKDLSNVGSELTMQLPLAASVNFQSLFETFDNERQKLDVINYGVSVTTLEEVFLKVAHGGDHDKLASEKSVKKMISRRSLSGVSVDDDLNSSSERSKSVSTKEKAHGRLVEHKKLDSSNNCGYFMRHMRALLQKRFVYLLRDKKTWFFGFILPIALIVMGLCVVTFTGNDVNEKELVYSWDRYNPGIENPVPFNAPGLMHCDGMAYNGLTCTETDVTNWQYGCCRAPDASDIMKDFIGTDPYEVDEILVDSLTTAQWLLKTHNTTQGSRYGFVSWTKNFPTEGHLGGTQENEKTEALMYFNWTAHHSSPLFISTAYEAYLKTVLGDKSSDFSFTVRNHPFEKTKKQLVTKESLDIMFPVLMIMMGFPFIPSAFIIFVVKEKENKAKHIQLVSGVSPHAYWLSTYLWDLFCFQIPCWATVAAVVGFDIATLSDGEGLQAMSALLFFYGPSMAAFCYLFSHLFKSHTVAQMFVIMFSFVTGFLCAIASIFMDIFPITRDINKILVKIYRIVPGYNLGHGLLRIVFGPLITMFDITAQNEENEKAGKPPVEWDGKPYGPLKLADEDIKTMIVEAVFYLLLAIALEYFFATPSLFSWFANAIYRAPQTDFHDIDSDVLEENNAVSAKCDRDSPNDAILVDGLTKVFPGGKFAVKGVSLAVPFGECFGLLGINGAGKTTTLSMLSGEFPPSRGRAWLGGKNILTRASEVRRLIGYCPQFDALFELMTGYEHLCMYARIKGIAEDQIEACVQEQIVKMDLSEHCHRQAGGYSGGNKRKLSVACAMIGQPSIIFLDEPSTGMDPVARRFMWGVISDICNRGKTSVILTTHSMEECEALCQRICIMVGGRFRCLGSSQHLKSKFGMGYQLEVGFRTPTRAETTAWADKIFKANTDPKQINSPLTLVNIQRILQAVSLGGQAEAAMHVGETFDEFAVFCFLQNNIDHFQAFMQREFPGSVMVEKQGMKMRFEVPHSSPQGIPLKLSAMFGTFQKNKETFNVQEYSLSQTSLEQIFNGFASKQEEEQGSAAGIIAGPASKQGNSRNLQHNSNSSFQFSNENPAAKHHDHLGTQHDHKGGGIV